LRHIWPAQALVGCPWAGSPRKTGEQLAMVLDGGRADQFR
jgi:hypothetical protein